MLCVGQMMNNNELLNPRGYPYPVGIINNDNFARLSLGVNYSVQQSSTFFATWTPDGTRLVLTGGNNTALNRLVFNYPSSSEYNTQTVTAQIRDIPSGTTGGMAVGFSDFSNPDGQRTIYARLVTNTASGDFGKIQIITYNGTTGVVRNNTALQSAITVNQFDTFTWVCTQSVASGSRVWSVTVTRSGGGSTSASFTEALTIPGVAAEELSYSTASPALFSISGNWYITLWQIDINDMRHSRALFVGTSITHVFFGTDFDTRFASQVGTNKFNQVFAPENWGVSAGAGDVTQRVIDKINSIAGSLNSINPDMVILEIGSNDINFGVPTLTWQTNYQTIVSFIKSCGKQVVHVLPFPSDSWDVTPLYNFINSTYPSDIKADVFTALNNGGTGFNPAYTTDGTHPNQAGMDAAAAVIIAALP